MTTVWPGNAPGGYRQIYASKRLMEEVAFRIMANVKKRKGFAAMSPEVRKKIASMGGKAAHAKGKAHRWTKAEAVEAGRKGGRAGGKK